MRKFSRGNLEVDILAVHDAAMTNPRKVQQQPGKFINRGRHVVYAASLDQLPEAALPPNSDDPLGGIETRAFLKAWHRGL